MSSDNERDEATRAVIPFRTGRDDGSPETREAIRRRMKRAFESDINKRISTVVETVSAKNLDENVRLKLSSKGDLVFEVSADALPPVVPKRSDLDLRRLSPAPLRDYQMSAMEGLMKSDRPVLFITEGAVPDERLREAGFLARMTPVGTVFEQPHDPAEPAGPGEEAAVPDYSAYHSPDHIAIMAMNQAASSPLVSPDEQDAIRSVAEFLSENAGSGDVANRAMSRVLAENPDMAESLGSSVTDNQGGIAVMSFLRLSAITNSEMRDEIVEAFSISLRDIVEEDTPSPAPGD